MRSNGMNATERAFTKMVKEFYRRHGRHSLPWRLTNNPYQILVSEVMLQQTQVERVIPKYEAFLKRFPTVQKLAKASLGDVLREWQGLGYNRRAKMLHECAQVVVRERKGMFPDTYTELVLLPGIGPYTAGAVLAFAYKKGIPLIETNVRTVYLHHFFKDATDVEDEELIVLIERTLDMKHPDAWYAALMDYGSYLKQTIGNQNSRAKSYTKQTTFKGSDREIRGAILKLLTMKSSTRAGLLKAFPFEDARIDAQLEKLFNEGLIQKNGRTYLLP